MTNCGRLLGDMMAMQARDDEAVIYPAVSDHAENVIAHADTLNRPVLIPVGDHATRLLGVVEVVSRGAVDIRGWNSDLTGRQVLLVGTVVRTLIEFEMAAAIVRNQGAASVHGCAVEVTDPHATRSLDSFYLVKHLGHDLQRTA